MAISAFGPEDWGDRENLFWDEISDDYGDLQNDRTAAQLFSAGWLNPELNRFSPSARNTIRSQFFIYATRQGVFARADNFDWEAWRNYMGY